MNILDNNFVLVDMYVRYLFTLFDMDYNKYIKMKKGAYFENVFVEHI
jgi:hypothetical protein